MHKVRLLLSLLTLLIQTAAAQQNPKRVAMCELLANVRAFDGQEIAVEAFMSQDASRHFIYPYLRGAEGMCDSEVQKRPPEERSFYVLFPRGEAAQTTTEPTRILESLFREMAQHRARSLTVITAVVGVIRVAKKDPKLPRGYAGFGPDGYWPYAIEIREAREIR